MEEVCWRGVTIGESGMDIGGLVAGRMVDWMRGEGAATIGWGVKDMNISVQLDKCA